MKNRLTFSNVVGVLIENKKKTYQQHQLVRSMFSLELDDDEFAEITDADATKYSYWCSGTRPIPMEIIRTYDDEYSLDTMSVKRHFLSGVNGGLQSVTVESNGILYSQAAGCQQYNGMFS